MKEELLKQMAKLKTMFQMPVLRDHPILGLRLERQWTDEKAKQLYERHEEELKEIEREEYKAEKMRMVVVEREG